MKAVSLAHKKFFFMIVKKTARYRPRPVTAFAPDGAPLRIHNYRAIRESLLMFQLMCNNVRIAIKRAFPKNREVIEYKTWVKALYSLSNSFLAELNLIQF